MTQLAIILRTDPAGTVLTLVGDIDMSSSPRLCQVISDTLATEPTSLTIDLDDLRFCDCSGLRVLINGRKDADQRHVDYRVTNPHGQVAQVMDVSGVRKYLNGSAEPNMTPQRSLGEADWLQASRPAARGDHPAERVVQLRAGDDCVGARVTPRRLDARRITRGHAGQPSAGEHARSGGPVTVEIRPFDPFGAPDSDLAACHGVLAASAVVDTPGAPPVTVEAAIGTLRHPPIEFGRCRDWAAYRQGRLIGLAQAAYPDDHNSHITMTYVVVHPDERGQGVGTSLLRATLPATVENHRDVVVASGIVAGGAGARWIEWLGFRVTVQMVMQLLIVDSVPPGTWDVEVPSGYRLARWVGPAPADMIDSYAAARPAIRDAPLGESNWTEKPWTVASIRQAEQELLERGVEERVVVAIDTATGQISGLTAMQVRPHRREFGYQNDTSVLTAHRGHGLGRAMKAAMMRWLTSDRPDLERVYTTTEAENTYMINVNLAIGYHTIRSMILAEAETQALADRVAA